MRYHITHVTTYAYAEPVSLCQNVAHLAPRPSRRQAAEAPVLSITPDPAVIEDRVDYFGNPVCYFTVQEPHRELTVCVEHRVEVTPEPVPAEMAAWEAVRDRLHTERAAAWLDAYQFAFDSRFVTADPRYAEYARPSFAPGRPVLDAARDLIRRHDSIAASDLRGAIR
jgi:transglutaminase-like putative cysteine protease